MEKERKTKHIMWLLHVDATYMHVCMYKKNILIFYENKAEGTRLMVCKFKERFKRTD